MTAPANRICENERVANANPYGQYERTNGDFSSQPDISSCTSATRTTEKRDEVETGSTGGAPRQPFRGIPEPARSQILAALDASVRSRQTEEREEEQTA